MTHDPLCPYAPPVTDPDSYHGEHIVVLAQAVPCQCDLIAEVREDERRYTVHTINIKEPVAEHTLDKIKSLLAPRMVVNVAGPCPDAPPDAWRP